MKLCVSLIFRSSRHVIATTNAVNPEMHAKSTPEKVEN